MVDIEIDFEKHSKAHFVMYLAEEEQVSDDELLSALPYMFAWLVKSLGLNFEKELEKFKVEADKYYKWSTKRDG
jgi:hypothetical protein